LDKIKKDYFSFVFKKTKNNNIQFKYRIIYC
jgi:hypothetical protein